ncbi:serine carboxypeptidase-like 40 [Nymphaea colorata]|nr:serine carboxypeptidase-like 40 [Nymphaea colorata]
MAYTTFFILSSFLFLSMIAAPAASISDENAWSTAESLYQQLGKQVIAQTGSKEKDLVAALPGQPAGNVSFAQYAGYVAVDPAGSRNLFYYFVEAATDPESKPLVWWFDGGAGTSAFGFGALQANGPFHVDQSGESLVSNPYSWNKVANMLYVETPFGVGFSYSTNQSDFATMGDNSTTVDNFQFLANWLERFPEYKSGDLYLAGQNAGNFVSQLAELIIFYNNKTGSSINLKGIILGNPSIDDLEDARGRFIFHAGHGILSDHIIRLVDKKCNCLGCWNSSTCKRVLELSRPKAFSYNLKDVYDLPCQEPAYVSSVYNDPMTMYTCAKSLTTNYVNKPEVQTALHVNKGAWNWEAFNMDLEGKFNQSYKSIVPTLRNVMAGGCPIWIYSGDLDSRNPVTSTMYSLRLLRLKEKTPWYGWYITPFELAGYVMEYEEKLTFITIRGAGHSVVDKQPERGLLVFTSIIQGQNLPKSPFLHY